MIILTLGWRNLWRNARRSWITISAVATAFAFLMALGGLTAGMMIQMLVNGTDLLTGHLQVHNRNYLPDRNMYDLIGGDAGCDVKAVLGRIEGLPGVKAAAPRVYGFALLSTGEHSSGVQLLGVDPERESRVSSVLQSLIKGNGFGPREGHAVVLGDVLSRTLGAGVGSEVAVVTQAADGSLGNDLYEVKGIFRTGLSPLDRSLVLMPRWELQSLMALEPGQIHEIAARLVDPLAAERLSRQLNESKALPAGTAAESWRELLPQLSDYLDLAGGMGWFLISLVGLFAGLGVLNTMMMAVFERTREIGVLNAMGMKPLRILLTFLFESIFLGLLGLGIGFLGGWLLLDYLSTSGIDLRRWTGELSMINTRLDPILKAAWDWDQILWSACGLLVAVVVATLIPARRAFQMKPVEALRTPTQL